MRRALIAAIVAALAAAPSALAHVTITPTSVVPRADALLTVLVPNESKTTPIVGVVVRPDPSFDYEGVQVPSGWRLERRGAALVWRGGRIAPGELGTFALSGSSNEATTLTFRVDEHYADGRITHYRPQVTVAPAAAVGRDSASRTLGEAALAVGIAGTAIGLGAFFLALAIWLRGAGATDESLREGTGESLVASPE